MEEKDRLPTLFESLLGVDDLILVLLVLLFLLSLLLGLFGGGGGLLSLGLGGGLLSALGSRGSLQHGLTVSMLVFPLPRIRVPPPWLMTQTKPSTTVDPPPCPLFLHEVRQSFNRCVGQASPPPSRRDGLCLCLELGDPGHMEGW